MISYDKAISEVGRDWSWRCLEHSSRLMAWRLLILGGNFENILFVFSKLRLTWPDKMEMETRAHDVCSSPLKWRNSLKMNIILSSF